MNEYIFWVEKSKQMQKMLATKKDEDVQKGMSLILILRNKLG